MIWIFALAISSLSALAALGGITKNRATEVALSIRPLNGFAAETAAASGVKLQIAKNGGEFPSSLSSQTSSLAVQAFKSEPISPEAVAVLALTKTDSEKPVLMNYAFAMSRRQDWVTGWMILDSGKRSDVNEMLSYYDTILRASGSARLAIVPVLANALADDDFVEPFAELLSKDPPWANLLWRKIVTTPQALNNGALLRTRLHKSNIPEVVYRDKDLVNALVKIEEFESASKLYDLLSEGSDQPQLVKDSDFSSQPDYPPFDWQIYSTGEYGASLTKGNLHLSAISGSGGVFARQLVRLPKALLQIEIRVAEKPPSSANLHVELACAEDRTQKQNNVRIRVNEKSIEQLIDSSNSGCDFYWLDITGRASENIEGFDIDVKSLSLRQIQRTS